MNKLDSVKACVIIPTYNNAKTLRRVLDGVLYFSCGHDIFVINDGSTDETADILNSYERQIVTLTNDTNRGKGYSLRKGFAAAQVSNFEYAITIDSDGQHYADDIAVMIQQIRLNNGALLMGSRNMNQEGVPAKSSFGNRFSNFWFWVETGQKLPDTQTGFRVYPLKPLQHIKLITTKFETEIEVIVKLAWLGVKVIPVPIRVLYDANERVSHFRPFRDFTRISILNTYLVFLTMIYYLPLRIFRYIKNKGLITLIKEEVLRTDESILKKSLSVGFGVFMGIVPIWGFQLLVGIPLAVLFRLNKVLFITAANISIPPMIPVIIFVSYYIGGFFVSAEYRFQSLSEITLQSIHANFIQYATGACVLALAAGLVFAIMTYLLFSIRKMAIKQQ
jgi:glycosyltransferase involved in cell wall biosynthesis